MEGGVRAGVAAVVFDLDGTLVDSAPALRAIAARFLDELGAAPLTIEETRAFIGEGAPRFMERALAARGLGGDAGAFDARLARFREIYAEAPGEANAPYPGVGAALEALRAAGLPLGLCTNKPAAPTRNVLAALGWERLFGAVAAGDTLRVKKPDPAPLRHVAATLDVDAERVLFVGDSDVDAATAEACGARFAFHARGYGAGPPHAPPPSLVIEDFAELTLRRIDKIGAATKISAGASE